jgi:hypothetical protein
MDVNIPAVYKSSKKMANFKAHVYIVATTAAQAAADLYAMSQSHKITTP